MESAHPISFTTLFTTSSTIECEESNEPVVMWNTYNPLLGVVNFPVGLSLASVTKHQTIIYDSVDLNIGNGYDKTTGKFTTPSSGLYVFHITTGSLDSSHSIASH
jgi:hypothetical protein